MKTTAILAAVVLTGLVTLSAQAPDRTRPPQPGPAPNLKLPAIQKRQLTNGIPVWLVELHEVPVAQVNLVVFNGATDDPAGKFGLTNMMVAMLDEGAGARTALQVADAVDFLGAELGAANTFDASAVRLHVPVAQLANALPIMSDVVMRPTFPPEEIDRLRQERLTRLLQARDNPASIAAEAFARTLFGPMHRYGTGMMGTAQTINAFTQVELREQYASAFRPENSAILVVGDVAPTKLMPLLDSSFGGWKAEGTSRSAKLPSVSEATKREIYLVDKPDAPQSEIRIGRIGVPRSTPDYFPIQVMNTVLGGAFTSRLNMNLREKHGYTYGAQSRFDMRSSAGPFVAAAAVQTDKTSESLKEFFNELNAIQTRVPDDELARAKNYVSLRFPLGFESTGDISGRLEDLLVYRLPEDYFARYVPNIEAVTAADVERVARKYIQPNRLTVVVVGDRKMIEPGLRALNPGSIKILTIDDVFGPLPVLTR